MNIVKLFSNDWELVVDLDGGRIGYLKKKGVLIFGTFERIDKKVGNTHICAPNFANDGVKKYGLPFHGPFRDLAWVLEEKTENQLNIVCEDNGLNVRQIFSFITGNFNHKIIIENKNKEDRPINVAVHDYWSTEVGWSGILLNGFDLTLGIKDNDFVNLETTNKLNIPGKPLIKWEIIGFKYAKLWTGFVDEKGERIYDNNYVCIEPIMERDENFFGSDESMLLPDEKKELRQTIEVCDNGL